MPARRSRPSQGSLFVHDDGWKHLAGCKTKVSSFEASCELAGIVVLAVTTSRLITTSSVGHCIWLETRPSTVRAEPWT